MTTRALDVDPVQALTSAVRQFDRRRRAQQTLTWLPRGLVVALIIGAALAVAARLRPLLTTTQVTLFTVGVVTAAVVVCLIVIWGRRGSELALARRFDLDFDLRERVSTALALKAGSIHTSDWLIERQIADASEHAAEAAARLRDELPLPFNLRDWIGVIVLLLLIVILLILPNPQADVMARNAAVDAAIDDAAQTLEEIAEEAAADPSLDSEQRQTLLEDLRRQIDSLENPNITAEEAFASLSETSAALQERADQMGERSGQSQSALENMANALRQAGGGSEQGAGTAMEQATEGLQEIAQNASTMSEAEQQAAAQALQDAAAALQQQATAAEGQQTQNQNQQQAAEALQNAAEALQNNDSQTAEQQISEASEQLQQAANQIQQQQQSQQQLSEAAQQARDAASQVSQAQQQGEQSQPQQQGEQEGERGSPQQGEQPAGQQQSGLQSLGEGSQQQPSGEMSESGQGRMDASAEGQQSSEADQNATRADAGDAVGTSGSDQENPIAGAQTSVTQDNAPDGEGQREFEAVNVPRRAGGDFGDNAIILEADPGDSPVQEGDFSENPEGQVTVSYDQVFGDYRDAADRALDSGYVPLALRDVVRDYFTSLEPRR